MLTLGTEKANLGASSGCNGMLKKQSLRSMMVKCQSRGIMVGDGSPGCRAPMSSIASLIFLRSWSKRHLPVSFLITKIGEFQGLVEGTICPIDSCSLTISWRA